MAATMNLRSASVGKLEEVLGSELDEFCDALYARNPKWVVGSISRYDARFLFRKAATTSPSVAVEIGTASGFSTAVLCHALGAANVAGAIGADYAVVSYDIASRFYANQEKEVGDAARELLSPSLLDHISFRNPATAVNIKDSYGPDQLEFLFLDAMHRHPWPTLDLLASLDTLAPGAIVVLHDINLPEQSSDFPHWGAKHLFDGVETDKDAPQDDGDMPNIGSIVIPGDKEHFRGELLGILFDHEWEVDVDEVDITLALA
jgi:predicted O-methyltransferase YrrM